MLSAERHYFKSLGLRIELLKLTSLNIVKGKILIVGIVVGRTGDQLVPMLFPLVELH